MQAFFIIILTILKSGQYNRILSKREVYNQIKTGIYSALSQYIIQYIRVA